MNTSKSRMTLARVQPSQKISDYRYDQMPEPINGMGFIGAEPIERCSVTSR